MRPAGCNEHTALVMRGGCPPVLSFEVGSYGLVLHLYRERPMRLTITLLASLLTISLSSVAQPPSPGHGMRARLRALGDRLRRRLRPEPVTVVDAHTGETIVVHPARSRRRAPTPSEPNGGADVRRWIGIGLIALLVLLVIWRLPVLVSARVDQFVVLVAPFHDADGAVSQTGRSVAEQLARLLPERTGGQVVALTLDDPPAGPAEALQLLDERNADALVWGEVTPGGMLNQESLVPMLAYQPTGPFAPAAWDGYTARFALPRVYALSATPLNGEVIMPVLLGALSDYGAGRYDESLEALDHLLSNYPALSPALPQALRGNILWASGQYERAAEAYQGTGVMEAPATGASELALIANNLGVILFDAGRWPEATAAFQHATELLGDRDLGELRVNLALLALREGREAEAIRNIQPALELLEPSTMLLLHAAEAYRADGRFDDAQEAIQSARRLRAAAADAVPADLRALVDRHTQADVVEAQALLHLARMLGETGPLLWELQVAEPVSEEQLGQVRGELDRAARETEELARLWARRSASLEAANQQVDGLVATGQSLRATVSARERRRWQAMVEVEIGQLDQREQRTGLAAFWDSLTRNRSPLWQGRRRLEELLQLREEDIDSAVLLGHALLIAGELDAAEERFAAAAMGDDRRPEPLYGLALVALERPAEPRAEQLERARALLTESIDRNQFYFPARRKLAEVAEEQGDWATAAEQRRWLADTRPSPENRLDLGRTLRLSGPASYAEAEEVLLPLANQGLAAAQVELSRLYVDYGDAAAAQVVLERAQAAAPDSAPIAYELGRVLEQRGMAEEAITQYASAATIDPQFADAHLALARIYAVRASERAADHYRAALDAGASDPVVLKQIGMALIDDGQYEPATEAFRRAIDAANLPDPEAHYGLALAYLGTSRLVAAESEAQQALQLTEEAYPAALAALGDIAFEQGDLALATRRYEEALEQDPQLVEALIGLGRVYATRGEWDLAQFQFQQAVAADPRSAAAHYWLGEALLRQGDLDAASAQFDAVLALRQRYPLAYYGIAQIEAARGQLEAADAALDQALALRPAFAEALLLRAKIYEQQGDLDRALAIYSATIDANEQMAEAFYRRALLHIRADRLREARSDLERAVREQPNFPEAHYWLGRTLLIDARPQPALEHFVLAIEQRGGAYPEARFYQGLAEEQLGRRDDAILSFQIALDQAEGSVWASEARAALARLGGE